MRPPVLLPRPQYTGLAALVDASSSPRTFPAPTWHRLSLRGAWFSLGGSGIEGPPAVCSEASVSLRMELGWTGLRRLFLWPLLRTQPATCKAGGAHFVAEGQKHSGARSPSVT